MKLKHLFTVFALTASLSFFGCKEGHDHDHGHDHSGHDHDHAHGKAEEKTSAKEGTNATASAESKAKPYPLETCLVAGSKLGSMGEPYVFVHEGQEIKFCCESCMPKFEADTAKYLAKLTEGARPAASPATEPAAK